MRISVKVKPGAKREKIEDLGSNVFAVWVCEPAKENKANFAVLEVIAKHFGVGLGRVRFVSGVKSREKTIEIS